MKNIFLISIDTFRYDCVGYQPDKKELINYNVSKYLETPTLDALTEKSFCFTNCFSTNTYTTSSHASIFTGLYPPSHGVRMFYSTKLAKDIYTIAEILKVYGYRTVMFTDTIHLFSPLELDRGFDEIILDDASFSRLLLKKRKEDGFNNFFFVHFFDLHVPYLASENDKYNDNQFLSSMEKLYKKYSIPFNKNLYLEKDKYFVWQNFVHQVDASIETLMPLYIKGIRKFDQGRLRDFISTLTDLGYMENSLIILCSDHGEGRNDDEDKSSFGHSGPVFDNVIRVPLMLLHPDMKGKVIDKLVSNVDIFPTIVEMATSEKCKDLLPYPIDGINLMDSGDERPVYCETWLSDYKNKHWNLEMTSYILYQRALRTRSKKYIIYGVPEKFLKDEYLNKKDEDFLIDFYRHYLCRFESLDEFLENSKIIKKNPSEKKNMLKKIDKKQFCYIDFESDPFETNPIFLKNDEIMEFQQYFNEIIIIGNRSSENEKIFNDSDTKLLETITKKLFILQQKETVKYISQNKHLINEMIDRTLLESSLSDEEFIGLAHEIFLDRKPTEEEIREGLEMFRQGVNRRLYFNRKIFNNRMFKKLKSVNLSPALRNNLLELEGYKQKYEELQKSLIFRLFKKVVFLIDNIFFPLHTKRRSFLLRIVSKFNKSLINKE